MFSHSPPHVIIKLYAGRSEAQKHQIAEAVAQAVMASAGSSEAAVSVSIEDVDPEHWNEKVFEPDIRARAETLYKKPGYEPK
ncbi:4-oxalocrotonate tautomerase [Acidiphilium multivorum]|nr:4-oxalocrotonate tautomerase [Acidiphilium multivorum]